MAAVMCNKYLKEDMSRIVAGLLYMQRDTSINIKNYNNLKKSNDNYPPHEKMLSANKILLVIRAILRQNKYKDFNI